MLKSRTLRAYLAPGFTQQQFMAAVVDMGFEHAMRDVDEISNRPRKGWRGVQAEVFVQGFDRRQLGLKFRAKK